MNHPVRLLCESTNPLRNIADATTSARPFWWRGSSVSLSIALASAGAFLTSADIGTIIIEVKAANATESDSNFIRITAGADDCDAGFTADDWAAGTGALLTTIIPYDDAALAAGSYQIIVRHESLDGSRDTYLRTTIDVQDDASESESIATPPTPIVEYYTKAESDTRYSRSVVVALTGTSGVDTVAIQDALDAGGHVKVEGSGTFDLTTALVVGSDTTLELSDSVELRMEDGGALTNMIQTAAYIRADSNVTVAWSAGSLEATVTWTGHGLTAGDHIYLHNATPSQFIGVFVVESVTNEDTVVVTLWRMPLVSPAAISGSIKARLADHDIRIKGGKWNHNKTALVAGSHPEWAWDEHTMLLIGVNGLTVEDVTFSAAGTDCGRFSICTGATQNFNYRRIRVPNSGTDFVKVYGPCRNGHVDIVSGRSSGDDCVTLHTKETDSFPHYRVTFGDVLNVTVQNVSARVVGSLVHLYGSPDEFMDNIMVDNISGRANTHGFSMSYGATGAGPFYEAKYGSIKVRRMNASTLQTTFSLTNAVVESLVIEDSTPNPLNTTADPHWFQAVTDSPVCSIGSLVFRGCSMTTQATAKTAALVRYAKSVTVEGCSIALASAATPFEFGTTVGNVTFRGNNIVLLGTGKINFTASGSNVLIEGNNIAAGAAGYAFNSTSGQSNNFTLIRNSITGCTLGVVRTAGTATVNIDGFGNSMPTNNTYLAVDVLATDVRLRITDTVWPIGYTATRTPSFRSGTQVVMSGPLTGDMAWADPTFFPAAGCEVNIFFTQDGTGGRNVTWGSAYVFPVAWSNSGNSAGKKSLARFISTGSALVHQGTNVWY